MHKESPYGKVLREFNEATDARYLTTHHERDKETGFDYRGARFYDSDLGRFLSLDPMAMEYPSYSDYSYVLGNPIMFNDPTGMIAESPIFDKEGNYLGNDENGYEGEVLIMEDKSKFKEGMSHSEAVNNSKKFGYSAGMSEGAMTKVVNHIMTGTELNGGQVLKRSDFDAKVEDLPRANMRYKGIKDGKHQVAVDIGDWEWTVENIRATTVHEIEGHGIMGIKSADNHHKAYELEFKSKYWNKTTSKYKSEELQKYWGSYRVEKKGSPLPYGYYNMYKKYVK